MRCIYQSLAMKYKYTFNKLNSIGENNYSRINILGGGIKDTLLCRLTASACGVPVKAGPVEATVIGNIATQFMALGDIKDINEARDIIAASFPVTEYLPEDKELFDAGYEKYKSVKK